MNLSHPLASLIPSLDAACLEVLTGIEGSLGTTQIHRLAGRGSRAGHQKVLDRLVEHGLVTATRTNLGYVYRLNREHLLAPMVLAAVDARRAFIETLRREVAKLPATPLHASIFGSTARKDSEASSDVDLCLVLADGTEDEQFQSAIRQLEDRLLALTGNRLETLVFEATRVCELLGSEPVLDAIRDEGIVLLGNRIDAIASAEASS